MFSFSSEILLCIWLSNEGIKHKFHLSLNYWQLNFFVKGNLLLKLKHVGNVVRSFLKKLSFHNFSSSMYILLNKIDSKTRIFIWTGCCEYLYISVCILYEDSFTQIKWRNAHEVTLRAVLEMLFVCLCPHWDVTHAFHTHRHFLSARYLSGLRFSGEPER